MIWARAGLRSLGPKDTATGVPFPLVETEAGADWRACRLGMFGADVGKVGLGDVDHLVDAAAGESASRFQRR